MKSYIDEEGHQVFVYSDGSKEWFKNEKRHRDGDKPAIAWAGGSKYWYKNGKLHRDGDKPAIVDADGTKYWYKNGLQHRDGDKHAVVCVNGVKTWYKNGYMHRENNMVTHLKTNNGANIYCLKNKVFFVKEYWARLLLMEY